MSYRHHDHKPHKMHRSAVNITTPIKLFIHNGTATSFAFPCWYQEVKPPVPARIHNHHLHDHHGWPSWRHTDHICQMWIPEPGYTIDGPGECRRPFHNYIDYSKVTPIHLLSDYEGYDNEGIVAWVEKPEGIDATAYVDENEDWVVRVDISANDADAVERPQVYRFSVFLDSSTTHRRDLVVLAELIVLPSAYQSE